MMPLCGEKKAEIIEAFSSVEVLLNIDNTYFDSNFKQTYQSELQLNKAKFSDVYIL